MNRVFVTLTPGINYLLVTADIAQKAIAGNKIKNIRTFFQNWEKPDILRKLVTVSLKKESRKAAETIPHREVLQWNIWHGGNIWQRWRERIIDLIKQSGADVVTMQEGYGSQEMIAKAIGFNLQTPSPGDKFVFV